MNVTMPLHEVMALHEVILGAPVYDYAVVEGVDHHRSALGYGV
jgi:hypothetical protein